LVLYLVATRHLPQRHLTAKWPLVAHLSRSHIGAQGPLWEVNRPIAGTAMVIREGMSQD
jgi:hypothetical protein